MPMSHNSQRGYLFRILQRAAGPVGRSTQARHRPVWQGPLEQSAALDDTTSADFSPDESSSAASFEERTASDSSQTKRTGHAQTKSTGDARTKTLGQPQTGESLEQVPTHSVAPPEVPRAIGTRSVSSLSIDRKILDSPSKPAGEPARSSSRSDSIVRNPQPSEPGSMGQTESGQPPPSLPVTTVGALPQKPSGTATGSRSSSSRDREVPDSAREQSRPSVQTTAGEPSSTPSFNRPTVNHDRARHIVQSQTRHVPPPSSPALADTVDPEEPTATAIQSASSSLIDDEPASAPPVAQSREPRFPKLIVIEHAGKTSVSHIQNEQRIDEQHIEAFASPSLSPNLATLATPVTSEHQARLDGSTPANQIAIGNSSQRRTVQPHDSSTIELRPEQTPSLESGSSSVLPALSPEHARFHTNPTTARRSEQVSKLPVVRTHAEEIDESVTWPISTRGRTEQPSSRSLPDSQPQHGESTPKLTINRLDVQIVNQPPAAPAPVAPAAPAVRPPTDNWERLERHLLGRLDLIF